MNRLLTTLLVWLLMAALPVHALAATVQMSCAHGQQHAGGAAAHQHGGHDAGTQVHDAHAQHGDHALPDAAWPDQGQSDGSTLTHASCSACSAFCVGAVAPPSAPLSLPSFDGSDAVFAAPAGFGPGFIPEGLHRPPRR